MNTDSRPELTAAAAHARRWLADVNDRPIPATTDAATMLAALPARLPEAGQDPTAVVDELVAIVEPGLMAIQCGSKLPDSKLSACGPTYSHQSPCTAMPMSTVLLSVHAALVTVNVTG